MGNQLIGIVFEALLYVLAAVEWIIIIWVLLSWILLFMRMTSFRWRHRQAFTIFEQINDIFERMTRPFLRPFRRFLRRFDTAGIDFSPLLLLLVIWLIRRVVEVIATPFILSK
ncbi:MAG TPA: YggT family protein [Thermoanaerobaculia bacterium]|nr:YggT family protein [Thermoanaerobaculia bacterium]